jgi:hypothetical protein
MILIMGLFGAAALADDGIALTNRALTRDRFSTDFDPIGFELFCAAQK